MSNNKAKKLSEANAKEQVGGASGAVSVDVGGSHITVSGSVDSQGASANFTAIDNKTGNQTGAGVQVGTSGISVHNNSATTSPSNKRPGQSEGSK